MQEQYGPFQKSPKGYDENEYLGKVEKVYRSYADIGKKRGMDTASEFLNHYLDGSGTPKYMSRDQARGFNFIHDAEATNQKRFENSFMNHRSGIGYKISKLKPGQTASFEDDWDYVVKPLDINPRRNLTISDGVNGYLAFGKTNMKSKGIFTAKRNRDSVDIQGTVDHDWSDVYDFSVWGSLGAGATALGDGRKAKPFDFGSQWKKKFYGTSKVRNGRLYAPNFVWEDNTDEQKE